MNRGVARRTIFENRSDARAFLALLAREVRSGCIEVHAYCLMPTHFHLLVRSPCGELAGAMMRVQRDYARRFNRERRRDGPLLRGRYRSRRVESETYRRILVRYIDLNPVEARLVDVPALHPFGSAWHYARKRGPIWLRRGWVESVVAEVAGSDTFEPQHYVDAFGRSASREVDECIRRVATGALFVAGSFDHLLDATPDRVRAWMKRKALLADGVPCYAPVCIASAVATVLAEARADTTDIDDLAWTEMRVGLLRDLSGSTFAEISKRTELSTGGAGKAYARYIERLRDDAAYVTRAAALAAIALRRGHIVRVLQLARRIESRADNPRANANAS